ncbi:pilus assembly PilX family protein [Undibacterium sp. RuTC16W]|uniref:pilus assembly PilX family protein n=1 Tax=Undibacterium sp. RuTC16W TaxID=3413048 RepID=UPI003BF279E2
MYTFTKLNKHYKPAYSDIRQSGASLIVSLLMLIVVLILGLSLANMSLQGEKASRSDRDRQIALQAAEASLKDAELDIDPQGTPSVNARGDSFDATSIISFIEGCTANNSSPIQGMCLPSKSGLPIWQTVDLKDSSSSAVAVEFGKFTGQTMVIGKSSFPAQLPRYIIEAVPDVDPGGVADTGQAESPNDTNSAQKYIYRITAIGFGANATTQVVLQSFYRKALKS